MTKETCSAESAESSQCRGWGIPTSNLGTFGTENDLKKWLSKEKSYLRVEKSELSVCVPSFLLFGSEFLAINWPREAARKKLEIELKQLQNVHLCKKAEEDHYSDNSFSLQVFRAVKRCEKYACSSGNYILIYHYIPRNPNTNSMDMIPASKLDNFFGKTSSDHLIHPPILLRRRWRLCKPECITWRHNW